MSWEKRPFEKHVKWLLTTRHEQRGDELWTNYKATRNEVLNEILPNIHRIETELTDHSSKHIQDVIDNACLLLGFRNEHYESELFTDKHGFTPYEMLTLLLGLFLHDIGNILGRREHQDKVAEVWSKLTSWAQWPAAERRLILDVCRAHSAGGNRDFDTLNSLLASPRRYFLKQPVRIAPLATLVRFADELAEGEQRTARFLIDAGLITDSQSLLFHSYANTTRVSIDNEMGRIALTYTIDLTDTSFPVEIEERREFFHNFLKLIFQRALKLNKERQLARYYAPNLSHFRETSISIVIEHYGIPVCALPTILLNELHNGIGDITQLENIDASYNIEKIAAKMLRGGKDETPESI